MHRTALRGRATQRRAAALCGSCRLSDPSTSKWLSPQETTNLHLYCQFSSFACSHTSTFTLQPSPAVPDLVDGDRHARVHKLLQGVDIHVGHTHAADQAPSFEVCIGSGNPTLLAILAAGEAERGTWRALCSSSIAAVGASEIWRVVRFATSHPNNLDLPPSRSRSISQQMLMGNGSMARQSRASNDQIRTR